VLPVVFALSLVAIPPVLPAGTLSAAGAASGRPDECFPKGAKKGPTVWTRARSPSLGKYCDLLARGLVDLRSEPARAKEAAKDALKLLPGKAAPHVLLARAEAASGSWAGALKEFEEAIKLDARSIEDPVTLTTLARVYVKNGKIDEALSSYRTLVPRNDLLGGEEARVRVLLEAALTAMAAEAAKPEQRDPKATEPPRRMAEALAFLREARQKESALQPDVLLTLALALDRTGDRAQADTTLAEAVRAGVTPAGTLASLVTDPNDKLALEALASESGKSADAIKGWEAYLASSAGKGPFAASAKGRLEAVKRGGGGAKIKKGK